VKREAESGHAEHAVSTTSKITRHATVAP